MLEPLLREVRAWAQGEGGPDAVALAGSHARCEATPGSDVDLLLLARGAAKLLDDTAWVARFGRVEHVAFERWGRVTSVRVRYAGGPVVEFGIATPDWATDPDEGSRRVVAGGFLVVWDPGGLFAGVCPA